MKKNNPFLIILMIMCLALSLVLAGCNEEAAEDAAAGTADETQEEPAADAYDEYIRAALDRINGDSAQNAGSSGEPGAEGTSPAGEDGTQAPTKVPETRSISTDRNAPSAIDISSMESPDVVTDPLSEGSTDPFGSTTPTPTEDLSPSPTEDPNATPTPEPTPYITPEEFDVGKCCIYINGESDSGLGTEVVTAINKVRKDLGYKELVNNKSLATCADRRTRETVARFDHVRPNGQMFYSLAPEHFKAEMIVRSRSKGEEIVDQLIKNDPVSRNLIFTEKYQSVGASSFKCNGDQYTVVSFGL